MHLYNYGFWTMKKQTKVEKLSKKQIDEYFDDVILPGVIEMYEQDGVADILKRAEQYNIYINNLHSRGVITEEEKTAYLKPI